MAQRAAYFPYKHGSWKQLAQLFWHPLIELPRQQHVFWSCPLTNETGILPPKDLRSLVPKIRRRRQWRLRQVKIPCDSSQYPAFPTPY
ncbi:MAG: hypothetical protein AAFR21_13535 [Pseudomonadota bacterium]